MGSNISKDDNDENSTLSSTWDDLQGQYCTNRHMHQSCRCVFKIYQSRGVHYYNYMEKCGLLPKWGMGLQYHMHISLIGCPKAWRQWILPFIRQPASGPKFWLLVDSIRQKILIYCKIAMMV